MVGLRAPKRISNKTLLQITVNTLLKRPKKVLCKSFTIVAPKAEPNQNIMVQL
jgi:hypothetical protein